MTNASALAAWSERGLRKVTLPTGTMVKVRLPAMESLIRRGVVPAELRKMALQFATAGVDLDTLSDEDLERFLEFKGRLVAEAIKYVAVEGARDLQGAEPTWEPVTLTYADLTEQLLDDADVTAINAVVMRQATPERVSADSLENLGLVAQAQVERTNDTPGQAVPDYAEFRQGQGGPADRAPGADVGDAAVDPPGDLRSGHSVRG